MTTQTASLAEPTVPRVLVGIPTYNRASALERAVDSVLRQTGAGFQVHVLIMDNGSHREALEAQRRLDQRHTEVTLLQRKHNVGLIANYNLLLAHAVDYMVGDSDYFMFLSDDDLLSERYIEAAVDTLVKDPDCALAAGRTQLVIGGEPGVFDPDVQVCASQVEDRIRLLARHVTPTGVFSGVMRGSTARALPAQPRAIGHDWVLLYNVAALGTIRTTRDGTILRSTDGISAGSERLRAGLGVARWQGLSPLFTILVFLTRDILWRSPVFVATMSFPRRCRLVASLLVAFTARRARRERGAR